MAMVKKNMMMKGLSGSLGPDHYARITKDGRTIISKKPDFGNRQFSEAQLNVQGGMKQAAAYAKASKNNPVYVMKAAGTAKNGYNVALGDWFNAPIIHYIDWSEGHIRVRASDDVMVTRVTIMMLNQAGQCLEQGDAELQLDAWWEYQAANNGVIRVEAWDLAGNIARQEFDPPSPSFSVWENTSPIKKRRR